jgi:hypothetical protein
MTKGRLQKQLMQSVHASAENRLMAEIEPDV